LLLRLRLADVTAGWRKLLAPDVGVFTV
jgi:hypothetical protein